MDTIFELTQAGVTFRSKKGAQTVAVEDFSLTVSQSEIMALVGPSGCGKSTLLRVLAGLQPLSTGNLWIGGGKKRPGFSEVAIVFQRPTLLPWLTVMQNVLFPLRALRRRPDRGMVDRAQDLLALVGLGDMADHMPHELSGGMQQRASIARSLILDPKILLMDEPFGALDALTREDLQLDLLDLHMQTQKTILLVTHSINEAVLLADRVAVMSAKPGNLQDLLTIDLPRPRGPEMSARQDFQAYAQQIRTDIFGHRTRKRP